MDYRSIIVGLDFSEHSLLALRWATKLAERWGAVLHLIHAASTDDPVVLDVMLETGKNAKDVIDSGTHKLEQLAAELPEGIEVDLEVSPQWPEKVLLKAAAAEGAMAVVLGSRGLDGFDRLMLGSVAQRVARYAPVPVLVCKETEFSVDRVLVGTDFTPVCDEALRQAAELVESDEALELVHAWIAPVAFAGAELPEPYRKRSEEQAAQQVERVLGPGRRIAFHCALGRPFHVLSERSEEVGADLVVVGSHGRKGLGRLFLGSEAENAVHRVLRTVLVARAKK